MLHGVQRQPNVLFSGALPLASAGVGGYMPTDLYIHVYPIRVQ